MSMAMEMVAAAWKDVGWSVHGWLEDWFYPADGFGADAGSGDPAYNERGPDVIGSNFGFGALRLWTEGRFFGMQFHQSNRLKAPCTRIK